MMEYNLGSEGDALYRELLELFEGLTEEERNARLAKLTLAFMNEIGSAERIRAIVLSLKP